MAVIIPGGVLVQHLGPIRSPRHDVQPVASLQGILAPRTRLVLRLQEGGGRLDAEQRARAHENWKVGVKRGRQTDVKKGRRKCRRRARREKEWTGIRGGCGQEKG